MSGYAQSHITGPPAKYVTRDFRVTRQSTPAIFPYAMLVAFFVLLYSQLPLLIPALDGFRLVYLVGGLGILALVVERASSGKGWDFIRPESALLLGFLVAAGLSCFGALWMRSAVENTLDLAKMAALYFLITNSISNGPRLRRLLWVVVLGGLFPAIGTLIHHFQGMLVEGRASWIGIFANPNELAYSLIVLIPLAVYLASNSAFPKSALVWGIIGTYIAAIFFSFSRGGMLGLLTVLGLLGLKSKRTFPRLLMVAMLVLSVAFILRGWSRSEGFTNLSQDADVQSRLTTFRGGLAMFADHPLTGVGLGCSIIAWPLYAPPDMHERWLIIHNTFIQVLSETGILGFACFVFLIGMAIYDARRIARAASDSTRKGASHLAMCLELALWGFVACAMSGGFVLSWFPYLLIGLVASLKKLTSGDSLAAVEL